MQIRKMTIADYEKVYALWMSCKNMGFNDIDDSKEGIARFLERNPNLPLLQQKELMPFKNWALQNLKIF